MFEQKSDGMAESKVLELFKETNRPYNVTLVVNMLQKYKIGKAQIERALSALVNNNQLNEKEFGKTKIYFPKQDGLPELDPEVRNNSVAQNSMKISPTVISLFVHSSATLKTCIYIHTTQEKASKMTEIQEITEQCKEQSERIAALKKELAAANQQLSVPELRERIDDLQTKASNMEGKLVSLRSGATLISAEDVKKVETDFKKYLEAWAKRKRIFRDIWDAVSENIPGKQADLFESMGVETDEAVGEELSNYQKILQQHKRPRKQ